MHIFSGNILIWMSHNIVMGVHGFPFSRGSFLVLISVKRCLTNQLHAWWKTSL